MRRRGWSCAIGPWVAPDSPPAENAALYRAVVDRIAAERLDAYLSIKPSTLGFDPGLFDDLLRRGAPAGVRIHCDSIGPEAADPTMRLIERAARDHRNIGSTVPAGWRRSPGDALRLAELGVAIRIVKGQWPDPGGRISGIAREFVGLARLLAGKGASVAPATHHRRSARRALEILTAAGDPCEVEQISGLPWNCAGIAREFGVPFRVYIPFGYPYLPYDIRQVRARPAVVLWALRDFAAGRHRKIG